MRVEVPSPTPAVDETPSDRERRIAETLAFMVEHGYDFVAPGEVATIVRTLEVTNDEHLGTAYVRLCDAPVVQTVEYSDTVNLDVGEWGQVVGIELLYPPVPAAA